MYIILVGDGEYNYNTFAGVFESLDKIKEVVGKRGAWRDSTVDIQEANYPHPALIIKKLFVGWTWLDKKGDKVFSPEFLIEKVKMNVIHHTGG